MTANHSPTPLVLLAPHAPPFATPTASVNITHRSLSWELRRDWMPAVSDGEEGTAFTTALNKHADPASHILYITTLPCINLHINKHTKPQQNTWLNISKNL